MLFFKKDLEYMKCLSCLLRVCENDPLCELAKRSIAILQDYHDFDKASRDDFRGLCEDYFGRRPAAAPFKGLRRLKKIDDYQYIIPKLESYVAKLHTFIAGGKGQKARRMAGFLKEFPAAYYRNDFEGMQAILYYEPLRFLE